MNDLIWNSREVKEKIADQNLMDIIPEKWGKLWRKHPKKSGREAILPRVESSC